MPDSREDTPDFEAAAPSTGWDLPNTAERNAGERPLPQFITPLASLEQQVGTHVIHALQHPGSIAVLSTVVSGTDGSQQIVSIGLDPDRFVQVQELLSTSMENQKQRVQCMGFHCQFVDAKDDGPAGEDV